MTKKTLSVGIMVGNNAPFLPCCIDSVKYWADEIVIVLDSRTNDGTEKYCAELQEQFDGKVKVYWKKWIKGSGTKDYLLKKCTKDWVLLIASDEVLSDNAFLLKEEYIQKEGVDGYNIRGHHFIYHLGLEDNIVKKHYWRMRLVRRTDKLHFEPNNYHALLKGFEGKDENIDDIRIFHMGYVLHLEKIMRKHWEDTSRRQLDIHTPEFLMSWLKGHLFGGYPVKPVEKEVTDLFPTPLKQYFDFRGLRL